MRKPKLDVKQIKKTQKNKNGVSNIILAITGVLALLTLLFGIGQDKADYEDVYYDE